MEPTTLVGPTRAWVRDFALVGVVTGALAPYFVIFDPAFALGAGLVGGLSGAALGAGLCLGMERARRWLPLSAILAGAAVLGAGWGGLAGAAGGVASFGLVSSHHNWGGVGLGAFFGACSGLLQLGWMFLPYLLGSTRRTTWPVVGLAVLAAPFMGWIGFLALASTLFGGWMFALPALLLTALALETSVHRARALADGQGSTARECPAPVPHRHSAAE